MGGHCRLCRSTLANVSDGAMFMQVKQNTFNHYLIISQAQKRRSVFLCTYLVKALFNEAKTGMFVPSQAMHLALYVGLFFF